MADLATTSGSLMRNLFKPFHFQVDLGHSWSMTSSRPMSSAPNDRVPQTYNDTRRIAAVNTPSLVPVCRRSTNVLLVDSLRLRWDSNPRICSACVLPGHLRSHLKTTYDLKWNFQPPRFRLPVQLVEYMRYMWVASIHGFESRQGGWRFAFGSLYLSNLPKPSFLL